MYSFFLLLMILSVLFDDLFHAPCLLQSIRRSSGGREWQRSGAPSSVPPENQHKSQRFHCFQHLLPTKDHIWSHCIVSRSGCFFVISTCFGVVLYFGLAWFCHQRSDTPTTGAIPAKGIFSSWSLSIRCLVFGGVGWLDGAGNQATQLPLYEKKRLYRWINQRERQHEADPETVQ